MSKELGVPLEVAALSEGLEGSDRGEEFQEFGIKIIYNGRGGSWQTFTEINSPHIHGSVLDYFLGFFWWAQFFPPEKLIRLNLFYHLSKRKEKIQTFHFENFQK